MKWILEMEMTLEMTIFSCLLLSTTNLRIGLGTVYILMLLSANHGICDGVCLDQNNPKQQNKKCSSWRISDFKSLGFNPFIIIINGTLEHKTSLQSFLIEIHTSSET